MKKYLITPVLVCLFLVGCSSEDGSHNHDHDHSLLEHDHGLLHSHDLVLEEEVGSNKTRGEKFELVKIGMTFEEVKFVMGFPDSITYKQFNWIHLDPTRVGQTKLLVWVYILDEGEILKSYDPRTKTMNRIYRLDVGFIDLGIVFHKTGIGKPPE